MPLFGACKVIIGGTYLKSLFSRWQADYSSHVHKSPAFAEEEKLERAWTPKTRVIAGRALNPDAAGIEKQVQ